MKSDTLMEALNINFLEIGEDFISATMPVDKRTRQPAGLLHGGASVALAETVGSVASMLCVEDLNKQAVVGISIHTNHLKAKSSGHVTAICSPVKIGRTIHVWHIEIVDEDDDMISICSFTTKVISK